MTEPTSTAVRYELTIEDYREMMALLCAKVTSSGRMLPRIVGLIIVFVVTYNLSSSGGSGEAFVTGMLVGIALLTAYFLLIARANKATQKLLEPRPGGALLTSYEISIGEDGLLIETPTWGGTVKWSGFVRIEETKGLLLLQVDSTAAYPVPKRAFDGPEGFQQFRAQLEQRINASN